ncbi:hypothetical protein EKD04_021045 [Chloroflexales bacterium ZM16-3]|nr:hypothetical protein [Chloroflexales bacterium ZM16-3]
MSTFADLELGLSRSPDGRYSADLRFNQADNETDNRVMRDIEIDLAHLLELSGNPADYGSYLSGQLFTDPKLRDAFQSARARA